MKYIIHVLICLFSFATFSICFAVNAETRVFDRGRIIRETPNNLLDGSEVFTVILNTGENVTVVNDYSSRLAIGDSVVFERRVVDGLLVNSVVEVDRSYGIFVSLAVFVVIVLALGGIQGLRSLISLAGSLLVVVYVLVPGISRGLPALWFSILISIVVLAVALFVSHGFKRSSCIALLGTVLAVSISGFLAWFLVDIAWLTGMGSDEAVYINSSGGNTLDLSGVLLAGMLVGVLGVLDDIAITQVAVVGALRASGVGNIGTLFSRALHVGKEHVTALVNTLAFAYTGSTLPLFILLYRSPYPFYLHLHSEIVVTEIVRMVVGSIGLIVAVPITTVLAVFLLRNSDSVPHVH